MVGTVLALLVGLSVMVTIASKFGRAEGKKTLESIVESAAEGEDDYLRLTPEINMDVCAQIDGELGCHNPLGVEPYCKIREGSTYRIHAFPTPTGICLNVTKVI